MEAFVSLLMLSTMGIVYALWLASDADRRRDGGRPPNHGMHDLRSILRSDELRQLRSGGGIYRGYSPTRSLRRLLPGKALRRRLPNRPPSIRLR